MVIRSKNKPSTGRRQLVCSLFYVIELFSSAGLEQKSEWPEALQVRSIL